ncbi:MAG: homoserine dehydrogenase, partial [Gemmatimonadaceae bacterium]|nr:homoserine dehydrogenase [Gloeobacterales cyanobacterium ES-bin-141]
MQRIRVALLGLGTVGSGVVRILADVGGRDPRLERIDLVGIAVRDINKARDLTIAGGLLTDDPFALVRDPEVDVVIEMMGGVELPYTLLNAALKQGKHVVTANKALLARHGRELFELARSRGLTIRYEAAIGGGTPLVQPLQQCFGANRIRSVTAIINGTTNYILTQMLTRSLAYEDALAEAQSLGYAEADPRADVEGNDAQEKIALLAAIAYRIALPDLASVYREGITAIHEQDVRHAQRLGFVIKLLALAV